MLKDIGTKDKGYHNDQHAKRRPNTALDHANEAGNEYIKVTKNSPVCS